MTLTNRGRRNPLIRRVRRHASLSTLFRTVDPAHAPVRSVVAPPILGRPIADLTIQAAPALSQAAIEEAVQRVTAVTATPHAAEPLPIQSPATAMPQDASHHADGSARPDQPTVALSKPTTAHQPSVSPDVTGHAIPPSPSIQQAATPAPLPPQPQPLIQQEAVQRETIQPGTAKQQTSDGLDDATWSRLQAAYRKFKDRETTGGRSSSTEATPSTDRVPQSRDRSPSITPAVQRQPGSSTQPLRRTKISEELAPNAVAPSAVPLRLPVPTEQTEPRQVQGGGAVDTKPAQAPVQRTAQSNAPLTTSAPESDSFPPVGMDSTEVRAAPSRTEPTTEPAATTDSQRADPTPVQREEPLTTTVPAAAVQQVTPLHGASTVSETPVVESTEVTPPVQLARHTETYQTVVTAQPSESNPALSRGTLPQPISAAAEDPIDPNTVGQHDKASATPTTIQRTVEPVLPATSRQLTGSDRLRQFPETAGDEVSTPPVFEKNEDHNTAELSTVSPVPTDVTDDRIMPVADVVKEPKDDHGQSTDSASVVLMPTLVNDRAATAAPVGEERPQEADELSEAALPLQDVWPVQRLSLGDGYTPLSSGKVTPVQRGPFPRSETAESVPAQLNESVLNQLENVQTARPTESSVHVIKPRRPRPRAKRTQGTADAETTGEGSPPDQGLVQRLLRPPGEAQEQHVDHGNAAPDATVQPSLVPTEIGPLPADLWSMIGESPPGTAQRTPPDAGAITEKRSPARTPVQPPAVQLMREPEHSDQLHHTESIVQRATATAISGQSGANALNNSHGPLLTLSIAEEGETNGSMLQRATEAAPAGKALAEATPAERQKGGSAAVDTEALARLVYAELRRKLATERERLRPLS